MSRPKRITVSGKPYVLVLLRATGKDALGRPEAATIHYDEREKFDIKDGDTFITCFVPESVARLKFKQGAS